MRLLPSAYRLLQRWALPPSFREVYAKEMDLLFETRIREKIEEEGRFAAARAFLVEGFDLVVTGVREWRNILSFPGRFALAGHLSESRLATLPGRRGDGLLGFLSAETRYLLRIWTRRPGFIGAAALTLAMAVGASSTIFSVVNAVLIRPLPFKDPDGLVVLQHRAPGLGFEDLGHTDALYFLYADQARAFEELGLFAPKAVNLTGGDQPARVTALLVTSSALNMLGVHPALGRPLTEKDDRPTAAGVAILSHELWQSRFGADSSAVGRTLNVDGTVREIVGVMPHGFRFPTSAADIFFPLQFDPARVAAGDYNYNGIARLARGVTAADAERDMDRMISMLPETYGVPRDLLEHAQLSARVLPLRDVVLGDVGRILWTLAGTAAFVFLIACANVANLWLVRTECRRQELAMRMAMGAGRIHLVGRALLECLLLGLLAGFAGLALAFVGIRGLMAMKPAGLPRLQEIGIDITVLSFAVGISLLAAALSGLIPLIQCRRLHLTSALKEGREATRLGARRFRVQDLLVVAQVALALVLLVAATLMTRTWQELRSADPGFTNPGSVLTLRVSLPEAKYLKDDFRSVSEFHQLVRDRLLDIPGVNAVGGTSTLPLTGSLPGMATWFAVHPPQASGIPEMLGSAWVTEGYFEAIGIEVAEGRAIDRFDHRDRTGAVAVSRSLARRLGGERSPIGAKLRPFDEGDWYTVVGVIGDVLQGGVDQAPEDIVYYPMIGVGSDTTRFAQLSRGMTYAIRTDGDPLRLVPSVRKAVWDVDPELPIAQIRTMEEVLSSSMARTSYCTLLLGIAALMALALGMVGVYGVVSHFVSQRSKEMGVRIALGATQRDLTRLVVGHGFALAVAGSVIGLVAALALTRMMGGLLFGVGPSDTAALAGVAGMLTAVTLLASYLPARRGASMDPVRALAVE